MSYVIKSSRCCRINVPRYQTFVRRNLRPKASIALRPWRQPTRRFSRKLFCANTSDQSSAIQKLTAEELEVTLQDRSLPIVIDFYATWCGPCLLMAEELKKVANELKDQVKIVKVDTDENPALSSQLKIEGLPTLLFLSSNQDKPALRLEGMIPAADVIKIINEEL